MHSACRVSRSEESDQQRPWWMRRRLRERLRRRPSPPAASAWRPSPPAAAAAARSRGGTSSLGSGLRRRPATLNLGSSPLLVGFPKAGADLSKASWRKVCAPGVRVGLAAGSSTVALGRPGRFCAMAVPLSAPAPERLSKSCGRST